MDRIRRRSWAAVALACALGALALLHADTGRAEDDEAEKQDLHLKSIVEFIAPRPGEVIADVGCGVGTWTFPLAKAVDDHGLIYAVDINSKKTEVVEKRRDEAGIKNIKVIHSVADNPMLPRDSLDAVFVNDVINHVDRSALAGFLMGIRSALKRSGRLIIRDPNGGPGRVIAECYRHGFRLIEARVPLTDMPARSFSSGWYALKLQRSDQVLPALMPRQGKPDRHLTRLHLAEELFRAGVLTRRELSRTWDRIIKSPGAYDPARDEKLDLITAAAAVGVVDDAMAEKLRARVRKP